jgi:hypothetical protein
VDTSRRTAVIVGVLFLAGYVGVFAGGAIYGPVLNSPDYLSNAYPNRIRVIIGMLIEVLLNDIPVVGIGVMLFPVLKKHGEGMALWYAGNRIIEAVTILVSAISALTVITISREYIAAGAMDTSHFQAAGALALAGRYWAFDVIHTALFIVGSLILFSILYKSRLVPRFISIWGLISTASLTAANVLGSADPTQGFQIASVLLFPIMTSEALLAIWLIAKGFNPSALPSGAVETGTQ